jgi:hypothetical protein
MCVVHKQSDRNANTPEQTVEDWPERRLITVCIIGGIRRQATMAQSVGNGTLLPHYRLPLFLIHESTVTPPPTNNSCRELSPNKECSELLCNARAAA